MKTAVQWVLKLGFVPQGMLTYAAGFTAFLVGALCLMGVNLSAYHLSCPDDPWALITGGAAAIGLRRVAERFTGKK